MRACFFETNPIPIKTVVASTGIIDGRLRLPLIAMEEGPRRKVLDAFAPHLNA